MPPLVSLSLCPSIPWKHISCSERGEIIISAVPMPTESPNGEAGGKAHTEEHPGVLVPALCLMGR